jgi:hypothetical protein
MGDLEKAFRASANHNLYLLGELLKIVEKLERERIAVIPLKGPVLAVTAFGDVSLRQFSDLDILIQERDISKARNQLAQLGFRCIHHPEWVEPYLRFGHELDFVSSDGGFRIDLQWRFAKKWLDFPLDPEAAWDRSFLAPLGGRLVRQLSLEDSMLMLCAHPYRHCWSCLKWISDVSAFIHTFESQVDWTRLFERARAVGGLRVLGLGVWLAQELGGAHLTGVVSDALFHDSQLRVLGQQVFARLFADSGPIGAHGSSGFLANVAFHLRARERLREKLPVVRPLIAHAEYLARRYAWHYGRRLFG